MDDPAVLGKGRRFLGTRLRYQRFPSCTPLGYELEGRANGGLEIPGLGPLAGVVNRVIDRDGPDDRRITAVYVRMRQGGNSICVPCDLLRLSGKRERGGSDAH